MDHFFFGKHKFTVLHGKGRQPLAGGQLVAKELCEYLKLKNTNMAVKKLPADCKQKIVIEAFKSKGRGGDNGVRVILNEQGCYNLIDGSRMPIAREFIRWVNGDVLPSIRRTGSYSIQPGIEAPNASP